MEQLSLEKMNEDMVFLKKAVESIHSKLDILVSNECFEVFESADVDKLSDEVLEDIERAKDAPKDSFVSQEDVEAEFLNG